MIKNQKFEMNNLKSKILKQTMIKGKKKRFVQSGVGNLKYLKNEKKIIMLFIFRYSRNMILNKYEF